MRNDGWNAVSDVCCWIVMCYLYLNVVMCMACGMVHRDVNYGAMWNVVWCQYTSNVVRCGMLQFQTWCRIEMQNVCEMEYSVVWNVVSWYVECYIMQTDAMWTVVIPVECGICSVLCEVRCGKWCDVLVWCDVEYVVWNMPWCWMWVWNSCGCGMVWDVDRGCVMWNMCFEMWWCEMVVPKQTSV